MQRSCASAFSMGTGLTNSMVRGSNSEVRRNIIFLISNSARPALEPTKSPIQRVPEPLLEGKTAEV